MSTQTANPGPLPPVGDDDFLSKKEIGQRLRLHPRQVHNMLRPGELWPVVRINPRVVRVRGADFKRYIAEKTWDPKPLTAAPAAGGR